MSSARSRPDALARLASSKAAVSPAAPAPMMRMRMSRPRVLAAKARRSDGTTPCLRRSPGQNRHGKENGRERRTPSLRAIPPPVRTGSGAAARVGGRLRVAGPPFRSGTAPPASQPPAGAPLGHVDLCVFGAPRVKGRRPELLSRQSWRRACLAASKHERCFTLCLEPFKKHWPRATITQRAGPWRAQRNRIRPGRRQMRLS